MAIQDDNTILNKGDLKAYHEAIAPLLGGTFMVSTNNSDYYSTDEKVVGVWTDGKPLYQKTIYVSSGFTNPTNLDNSLNTTDVSIISLEGSVKFGNQYIVFLNRANIQSTNFQMEVYSSDTGLLFYYGSSISGINWVSVTVKYTKTTDATGSATTTPGAYDINFPNTWKANTEIYFGNGVYGYRATGNMPAIPNTGGTAKVCEVRTSGVTNILQFGGTYTQTQVASPSGNHPRRFVSNNINASGDSYGELSVYQWISGAALEIDYRVPNNGTTWGLETTANDTYDVWVTYTK